MHFEDRFEVDAPVGDVWKFVTNPNDFAKVIPDLQKQVVVDDRRFSVDFRVGLGLIKGTMKMNFEFEEVKPESYVKLVGDGSGLQSAVNLIITLNLAPKDGRTSISWSADVTVTGTIMSMRSRFIEPTTKTKVVDIVRGINGAMRKAG